MLDWKILGATFAALLVVSTLFIGGFGIEDFFSDIFEKLSEWLGTSPFGTTSRTTYVEFILYPKELSFTVEKPVNITLDSFKVENFLGDVSISFINDTISLQSNSLVINTHTQNLIIHTLQLKNLKALCKFQVFGPSSNITSENGSIEIYNFLGTLSLSNHTLYFSGNTTRIKGEDWEIV